MIILLKLIIAIFLGLLIFTGRYIINDLGKAKSAEGYKESSIWQRFTVNLVFYVIIAALLSLSVFLSYFLIAKIVIG